MFGGCWESIVCDSITTRAKSKPGTTPIEKHHIVPKALGGTNDPSNLAWLTPREHYICHVLLVKMHTGDAKRRMWWALHRMLYTNNPYHTADLDLHPDALRNPLVAVVDLPAAREHVTLRAFLRWRFITVNYSKLERVALTGHRLRSDDLIKSSGRKDFLDDR